MRKPEERGLYREMQALLHDGTLYVCSKKELAMDLKTFSRRFSNEGMGFLSRTLPSLGKAVDTALSGNVAFRCPTAFAVGTCAVPNFLGLALRAIFDPSGWLREDAPADVIRWLRTFCFYSYKVEVPFSESQISEYCENFSSVDIEVGEIQPDAIDKSFRNVMRHHIGNILRDYRLGSPHDGPGIASDVNRFAKRRTFVPPSKVRNHFGRDFFHQPGEYTERESSRYLSTRIRRANPILRFLEALGHVSMGLSHFAPNSRELGYSKVLFVPKDSRGPRVIACEPSAHMFAQQAVRSGIYDAVENSSLTRGRVNFLDQGVNQRLTFDSGNATLDLKEASDRVSNALVADLFPSHIYSDMDACRTSEALLPDGRIVKLHKFAPMGNALCFPTMALLAYASVCASIYLRGGPLPSQQTSVYVYGDDIIVPNEWAQVAIEGLERVGLLVNKNKSFINSRFRESCGQDTFDSSTVTPLRRRKLKLGYLVRGASGKKVVVNDDGYAKHSAAVMNQAVELGFLNLAIAVETELSSYLKTPIPYGTKESSYICHIVSNADVAWRLNDQAGYTRQGKLRAYVFRDSDRLVDHTPYSRLRSSFKTNVCPISGDVKPGYLELGVRKPQLQIRTLKKWWIGSFV